MSGFRVDANNVPSSPNSGDVIKTTIRIVKMSTRLNWIQIKLLTYHFFPQTSSEAFLRTQCGHQHSQIPACWGVCFGVVVRRSLN